MCGGRDGGGGRGKDLNYNIFSFFLFFPFFFSFVCGVVFGGVV